MLRSRFTNFVAFENALAHLNFHVTAGESRNPISITSMGKRYLSSSKRPDQL